MTVTWWLQLVGTLLVLAAAVPANGVAAEFRRVPWALSDLGKVLFSKALVIALVLDLSLVSGLLLLFGFGRPLWFELLRLVVFGGVVVVLWAQWRTYRLILAEHTGRPADNGRHVGDR